MNSITFEGIVARVPCSRYRESDYKLLRELLPPGVTMTPVEVLSMRKVPLGDRLWTVLHGAVLHPDDLHMLAVLYAERALRVTRRAGGNVDPRSVKALKVRRRWLAGEASGEELVAAARAATAAAAGKARAWEATLEAEALAEALAAAEAAAAEAAEAAGPWGAAEAAEAAAAAAAAAAEALGPWGVAAAWAAAAAAWAATAVGAVGAAAWGAEAERQWQVNRTKRFLRSAIVRRRVPMVAHPITDGGTGQKGTTT